MATTVALTGASGFIGGTIAHDLRHAGYSVQALVRSSEQAKRLKVVGIQPILGELENPQSLLAFVENCQFVIHCAGTIRGSNRAAFQPTNVDGVSHLIQACLAQPSPPSFVLLSSLAAREPALSPYAWSKHEGEKTLFREAGSMKWVIFRPPAVYGPHDKALLPLFKLIDNGIGLQLGPSNARFSLIHVKDLSEVILRWLVKGAPAATIFEVDDGVPGGYSWEKVFKTINPHIRLHLHCHPLFLRAAGMTNEILARLLRYAPLLTTGKVNELLHPNWVCDSSPVTEALDWKPQIPLAKGLRHLFTSDNLME
ncbi:MAG: NAD-dependent epimerase/dehydratase family protein [Nitrospirota bacterium]|nr:NAD-dependent epimerase/dehydratase family protein [Nitrospirota bacterium]